MDPDATLAILIDDEALLDERVQAARDLHGWLTEVGFAPLRYRYKQKGIEGFCLGFIRAVEAVRAMPEVAQLRCDLTHVAEKNTQHIVDSSARLLEALSD